VERTGQRYATLQQAHDGAISGDTIKVAAGTYTLADLPASANQPGQTYMQYGIQLDTLTIEWETPGSMPMIDQTAFALGQGTRGGRPVGILVGSGSRTCTIRGLEIIGNFPGDSYGIESQMGYYYGFARTNPACTLTIDRCKLKNWADGVKTSDGNNNVTVNLLSSVFEDGSANGLTHGVYFSAIAAVNVRGCSFRNTSSKTLPQNVRGHLLKSRSRALTVEGSLFDPVGGCACCIDYPNGGTLNVKGNVILHYGATANSDENPPIKFGSEQQQTEMTVTLIGAISVGQVITGPAPENASGTVTGVYSAGTRIVYSKTQDGRYFQIGDEVRVGGVLRATINSKSGSPDGLSDDGRVHAINVSQNTFRKDQPTHPSFDDIALMWVYRMTTADGTDVPQAATTGAATVRNNILAGDVIGSATSATNAAWANNSSVARSTVSDLGVYSGGRIAGDPIVGDAPWTWAGEFTQPKARSDTFRGGL